MILKKLKSLLSESHGTFEGQEPGEDIVLLLRKHPFHIVLRIGVFGLLALLPIVVGALYGDTLSERGLFPLFIFVSLSWYLALWTSVFYALALYTLNVVIVTRERIIDSDQHALFHRRVSEIHMYRVQDISAETRGLIETFLSFGDLVVQSAGVEKQFVFHTIGEPEKVKDQIMSIVREKKVHPSSL